ncbi:MAG: acyl-CoA/acyl-ACP dehydrogenase [Fuerstiella sp.]|jgi:alkylation response protein AidB-like acyl-CoA dehydrogenase|nr:acyl-CoA/acyl-ACP dehydrogenase [Fuerstiella sp.]
MNLFASDNFALLLTKLQQQVCDDRTDVWPAEQLKAMADAGVMSWDVPVEWGGLDLKPVDQLEGLRLLSSACLVSTFVLTQRSAAARRIATTDNEAAKLQLLPGLLSGQVFATVGISHLTTSGQHLKTPLVQATETDDGYVLDGLVPWATGAAQADFLITGGTLADGRQLLAAIPTDAAGVQVQPPVELMALNASQTGAVKLNSVVVDHAQLLHGPMEQVMQHGTGGGAGSLGTSALAIGATAGTLQCMTEETQRRPDLREFVAPLQAECDQLTTDLRLAATGEHPAGAAAVEQLRRQANSLVLRSAQSWLAATKGAGYVAGHPAERAVRESMFFLVWSCPQPVLAANLRELACSGLTTS